MDIMRLFWIVVIGSALLGCGRRWSKSGSGITFSRKVTRVPFGRLRWSFGISKQDTPLVVSH